MEASGLARRGRWCSFGRMLCRATDEESCQRDECRCRSHFASAALGERRFDIRMNPARMITRKTVSVEAHRLILPAQS